MPIDKCTVIGTWVKEVLLVNDMLGVEFANGFSCLYPDLGAGMYDLLVANAPHAGHIHRMMIYKKFAYQPLVCPCAKIINAVSLPVGAGVTAPIPQTLVVNFYDPTIGGNFEVNRIMGSYPIQYVNGAGINPTGGDSFTESWQGIFVTESYALWIMFFYNTLSGIQLGGKYTIFHNNGGADAHLGWANTMQLTSDKTCDFKTSGTVTLDVSDGYRFTITAG